MIDSAALVWGRAIGTAARRVERPSGGSTLEPLSPPIVLDMDELHARLGSDQGQVRKVIYDRESPDGERETLEPAYGHWKVGDVELLYREGRVELRASLPKLLTGRNDVVLDERGVHDGLRELAERGSELAGRELPLRTATPTRLDYCYQWEVPSVAFVLEHVKAAFAANRKLLTEHVSPAGGRSLVYGYGTKHVVRFYDKRAEVAEQLAKAGELGRGKDRQRALAELRSGFDQLLRYEIQERRRGRIALVHESGYTAAAVRRELARTVDAISEVACRDVDAVIESYGDFPHRVAYAFRDLYLVDRDEMLPVARRHLSDSAYHRLRRRVRAAALMVGEFAPIIPVDAFERPGSSLWSVAA